MATLFPGSLDTFSTKVDGTSDVLAADTNNLQDAVSALQTKVGVNGSAVATSLDKRIAVLEAIAAQVLGVGQSWVNVLASPGRAHSTSYQNTTGRPIQVAIAADAIDNSRPFQVSPDNVAWVSVGRFAEGTGLRESNMFPTIPAGHYYRINGAVSITQWAELR